MSRRSAERRCARPEIPEAGVQTCLKYAGLVPRIQSHGYSVWSHSKDLHGKGLRESREDGKIRTGFLLQCSCILLHGARAPTSVPIIHFFQMHIPNPVAWQRKLDHRLWLGLGMCMPSPAFCLWPVVRPRSYMYTERVFI